MKTKIIMAVVVLVAFIGSNIGSFFGGRCSVKPDIKIIKKSEIHTKIVYRDYQAMTCEQMQQELLKYDAGIPRLDGVMNGTTFHATAGLGPRDWNRDFELRAGSGDSAKWYVVASVLSFVAGAVCGGAVDYKIHPMFER